MAGLLGVSDLILMKLLFLGAPLHPQEASPRLSAYNLLLVPACLLVFAFLVCRPRGRKGYRRLCRRVGRTVCCMWDELVCCLCALRDRVQQMGWEVNYPEELNWGFN